MTEATTSTWRFSMQKILYVDIESSPNCGWFWRPSHKMSLSHSNIQEERQIILASYAWNDDKPKTVTWAKDSKSKNKYLKYSDERVVKTLVEQIHKADLVVHQNGNRFDIPWIRGRAMKYGVKLDTNLQMFDTLKKSRAHLNLNSYRLDYLGSFFLEDRKLETGGFGLWLDCIAGDTKALKKMKDYCEKDVELLRDYHKYLLNFVPSNNHAGAYIGNPKWSCKTCGSTQVRVRKEYYTAAGQPRFNFTCDKGHNYVLPYSEYKKWIKERV